MEKTQKRNSNIMGSHFCMPKMKTSMISWTRKTSRPTYPISLLDRFREAVFRLIMFSALSKTATAAASSSHERRSSDDYKIYHQYDSHHSEAVADCIEFFKKSAINGDYWPSSTTTSSIDGGSEVEIISQHFI